MKFPLRRGTNVKLGHNTLLLAQAAMQSELRLALSVHVTDGYCPPLIASVKFKRKLQPLDPRGLGHIASRSPLSHSQVAP